MTILCNDNTYVIYYTDSRKGTISISKRSILTDALDVALVGKNRLNYGEAFDENLLHLLENFAAPEDSSIPGTPDITKTVGTVLQNPTEGQMWYNLSRKRLYVLNHVGIWLPLGNNDDVGGSSGVIAHGASIPLPVSAITGSAFSRAECSWNVSPWYFPDQIDAMVCSTDNNGCGYVLCINCTEALTLHRGLQIIKLLVSEVISTKVSILQLVHQAHCHQLQLNTPTPTPTHTPLTPTPTPTITPTISITPTQTPTPTPSPGIEYYLFSSFNPGNNTGNLGIGSATGAGYSNSSTVAVTDFVKGKIVTDGVNVLVPFYNQGLKVFQKTSGALNLTHILALPRDISLLM
jgi:hypothetical protein